MSGLIRTGVVTMLALAAGAAPASACLRVGIYANDPVGSLATLRHSVGHGVTELSTYLTAGHPLAPSWVSTANRDRVGLMVSWQPDSGRDGASAPHYRLVDVAQGRYDASLRALVKQLAQVRGGAVLRPMPEMNTPWYAWSGIVNGNTPAEYVKAWKRVRRAVRSAPGGSKIRLLWAPYAQNIPSTGRNQIGDYFPGASQVDLVGTSGYNFGNSGQLTWTAPQTLFATAYATIESIAAKPFWLAETGSTASGGSKAAWIGQLAALRAAMPRLSGLFWYDVRDATGNFTLRGTQVSSTFRALLREACR